LLSTDNLGYLRSKYRLTFVFRCDTFLIYKHNYCSGLLGPVHTTSEEFENEGFTLKTHQMFCVHNTSEEFKNATITFGFVFEANLVRDIAWLFTVTPSIVCKKLRFQNVLTFPCTLKRKAGVFKFLRFQERFRKAPFSWWTSVDGRPNCRNRSCVFKFLRRSVDAALVLYLISSHWCKLTMSSAFSLAPTLTLITSLSPTFVQDGTSS